MIRVLAIDPGQTTGYVVLETQSSSPPLLQEVDELGFPSLAEYTLTLLSLLDKIQPTIVVVEDYVVYRSQANRHIGQGLFTAKLIGVIEALCALVSVPVVMLPAAKKGRWPDARLQVKFPVDLQVSTEHTKDALKLGLVYLEERNLWQPNASKSESR